MHLNSCRKSVLFPLTTWIIAISLQGLLILGAFADAFPVAPHPELTPGDLCQTASERRYPERIKYCSRAVGSETKATIFKTYDATLGYRTTQMDRHKFKIDHYIPLCMGGSNSPDNLWPQHESIYLLTDPLEGLACGKMAAGRLTQQQAIQYIKDAKADYRNAPKIIAIVEAL